jgi:cytochrome c553
MSAYRSLRKLAMAGAVVIVTSAAGARADQPSAAITGAQIATQGTPQGAPPCSSCHGEHGEGQDGAGIPRLAGLNNVYVQRQLQSFMNGSRDNAMMMPIAKTLDPAASNTVADYYASLPAPQPAAATQTDPAGASLAERGDWSANIPACASCHGPQGLGVGAAFPAIARQPATYITNQLQAWRAGTRHDDPLGLMHAVATRLSDAQIAAVSLYYAAQPGAAANVKPQGNTP